MLKNKLHIYENPEETAKAVADLLAGGIKKDADFFLAVSGGSTPKLLFEILADQYSDTIPWENLKIFWVDERCVPPNDSESNYRMTAEALLNHVPIPTENVFRMKGEETPQEEAARYANLLDQHLPKKNELPLFDLVLLGMGDDGHTASIFSDNLALLRSQETVAVATHPQTGQQRTTLTGDVICNAKQVAFLVTGHGKAEVLEAIMQEKNDFERYPSYYILAACDAELYLDDEAAERI